MAQLNRLNLAALLLLVGVLRHYAWNLFPPEQMGVASKALGAMAALVLLFLVWQKTSNAIVTAVCAWYATEELQTVICGTAYLVKPWPIEVGQPMCSARVGFDIGIIGLVVVGVLAYRLTTKLSWK